MSSFFQEHLLIVCELLKANLYEFHKFNRESGGEVYFTMPRLQVLSNFYIVYLPRYHVDEILKCSILNSIFVVYHYPVFGGSSVFTWHWSYTL